MPSPDGSKVLIVAERDGNTVSPDRGVYLMDLAATVTATKCWRVLRQSRRGTPCAPRAAGCSADRRRRANGRREKSVARIYAYEKALFDFDSKHITKPGNKQGVRVSCSTPTNHSATRPSISGSSRAARSAVRPRTSSPRCKGTVNPELVYVVSSHYDSVAAGPGADDDSSGTAALLEAARCWPSIRCRRRSSSPRSPARRPACSAAASSSVAPSRTSCSIVGALNNDMIGWANDKRLDNTIRYSNPGIRDIQHARGDAVHAISSPTTRSTTRAPTPSRYYDAYGDIVGGIGSYPVLGNPHYHQPNDLLETRTISSSPKTARRRSRR